MNQINVDALSTEAGDLFSEAEIHALLKSLLRGAGGWMPQESILADFEKLWDWAQSARIENGTLGLVLRDDLNTRLSSDGDLEFQSRAMTEAEV